MNKSLSQLYQNFTDQLSNLGKAQYNVGQDSPLELNNGHFILTHGMVMLKMSLFLILYILSDSMLVKPDATNPLCCMQ